MARRKFGKDGKRMWKVECLEMEAVRMMVEAQRGGAESLRHRSGRLRVR